MQLASALRLSESCCLAVVGAGGKSSVLFTLSSQILKPFIMASTAHLAFEQSSLADIHYPIQPGELLPFLKTPPLPKTYLFTGPLNETNKWSGIDNLFANDLCNYARQNSIPLVFEADGSRLLPAKAPADHEPPIPESVDSVIYVMGMSVLGKPLSDDTVFRSELFSELVQSPLASIITPSMLIKVLCHPQGGLKNIPPVSRKIALLTQIGHQDNLTIARDMAEQLIPTYDSVLLARSQKDIFTNHDNTRPVEIEVLSRHETCAGIILAAGGSSRFGQPKPLLEWEGEPLIHKIAQIAIHSGLSPVIVITGAFSSDVETALKHLPVRVIENPQWAKGQSTSIKIGINNLPSSSGSAIFLLADQPFVTPPLIKKIIAFHQQTMAPIIIPRAAGRNGNPVLFDRITFNDLLSISGDVGGRAIFNRFPTQTIDWDNPNILIDIDTPEDFLRLKSNDFRI